MRAFLTGAELVLPSGVRSGATLVLEHGRVADITDAAPGDADLRVDCTGQWIVPGFVDVHVHGLMGTDVMEGAGAIARIASLMPQFGVTAFSPTAIASAPDQLVTFLDDVGGARHDVTPGSARVLPAHLESNFVNPDYRGAQALGCLRLAQSPAEHVYRDFSARDVLDVITRYRLNIAIVTLAPELPGGLALVKSLVSSGIRVSLGHSGATFDEARAAIAAGARQATHLFNAMRSISHRAPGLAGAVLAADEVTAELICDGLHVHPAIMHVAIVAKGPSRVMAITDGTAGAGLPRGSTAKLGNRPIHVEEVARLDDGTWAGSVMTMDRTFAQLVHACGVSVRDASEMCSTTPAREIGLTDHGRITVGAAADVVVLDTQFGVVDTWIGGEVAWSRRPSLAGRRAALPGTGHR
jgi:N-acetylglucosamine-6-phosphate deacetylase